MPSPRTLSIALYRAALVSGAAVGIVDGVRAAWLGHLGGVPLLACVALVAGFDLLVGATGGAVLAMLLGFGAWGRRRASRWWASGIAWLLVGGLAAVVPVVALHETANRNNRFLAAGIVALASLLAAAVAAMLGPALARVLPFSSPPSGQAGPAPTGRSVTAAGLLLLAPLAVLLVEVALFFVVWRTRAPLPRDVRVARSILGGALTAFLPWIMGRASLAWPRLSWPKAAGVALLLFGVPAGLLIRARWAQDFQFVQWNEVRVVVELALATLFLALLFSRRPVAGSRWRQAALLAGLPLFALVTVFVVSESEPARKAGSAHAGFTGDLVALGQRTFDFDHDGYSRFFGGGDCDDSDPGRNPGAQDWPDDGIDQDCDGKDASTESLRSPAFHPVPASVPADLKFLFVTIDTLRADRLGCYGYRRPTSPALDRLAGESVLFENGWAHAPSTRYSMPAIATSRWPSAIKWDESIWWPRIDPSMRTIGEALHDLGYTTAAFYAYLYFNRADRRGFERGIDFYDDECAALHTNVGGPAESVGSSARQMADKGIAFLREHGQEKFFLWLHFYDPHLNYERHPEAPAFGDGQADLYDGEIWFTDHHFGRVLDELKTLGLWDKTAIVVTGDHGESLGEHGISAHGYHLYAPHTKVPFIVRVPGLPPRRSSTPVGHVDLAPTLVNLARGPHQPGFLGRSMVDLLAGSLDGAAPQPVFQEVSYEGNVKRRAWVTASHHLIWNWTPDNTTECYDLAHDPAEARDLWGTSAGEPECSRLKADLRTRVALLSLPAGYGEKIAASVSAPGAPAPAPTHALDGRIGDALRVTGYDLSSPEVARGGDVELTVYFESLAPVPHGWRPFFHLDGPGGSFRNLDHVPVDGAYPVERWRPGQHIRDRQRIVFAGPPGVYAVLVGLFKEAARLPVTPPEANDGKDRLRVTTIRVQ
ncbi:MAG: sulfatase-like hydrolase/transferase [Polyangia bacterium]